MDAARRRELRECYEEGLLGDTIPFWIRHAIDSEDGGYLFCLDRDGSIVDTDKGMWQHGRFAWMLSTLYTTIDAQQKWLDLAAHGIAFMEHHAFDTDGKMFFHLAKDGQPIRKRRYYFTEAFAAIAFTAYGHAAKDPARTARGEELFDQMVHGFTTPGAIEPKFVAGSRPTKSFSVPMIILASAQCLRDTCPAEHRDKYVQWIDRSIESIQGDFMNHEHQAVLETVAEDGKVIDHYEGRQLCPGHAIEAAWFILHEARLRNNDPQLVKIGLTILDWMWERGWDQEHGGILYFQDLLGKPVQDYWHDMKFWWPQNETIIATLLAHEITEDRKYEEWHRKIHDWTYSRFPDAEHGEWFGYLHRDGRLSSSAKGNLWKGPFHVPRMQWYCRNLLS